MKIINSYFIKNSEAPILMHLYTASPVNSYNKTTKMVSVYATIRQEMPFRILSYM